MPQCCCGNACCPFLLWQHVDAELPSMTTGLMIVTGGACDYDDDDVHRCWVCCFSWCCWRSYVCWLVLRSSSTAILLSMIAAKWSEKTRPRTTTLMWSMAQQFVGARSNGYKSARSKTPLEHRRTHFHSSRRNY